MKKPHCSLGFHKIAHSKFESFAIGIENGVYSNPLFANSPVTLGQLQAARQTYQIKYVAFNKGGDAQKGDFLIAKTNLMTVLNSLASYVDEVADGDEGVILSTGFKATSTTVSTSVVPLVPAGITPAHAGTGSVTVTCTAVAGAASYVCIVVEHPLPLNVYRNGLLNASSLSGLVLIDVNRGKKKIINGLTPGIIYNFYYAAGNAAGTSDLSAPVTIMSV